VPLLLGQNVFYEVIGQGRVVLGASHDSDAPFGFAFDCQTRWLFVEPDSEPLQLILYLVFVSEGFQGVQDQQDEVAGPGHPDDLLAAALAVLGALDDAGEVEHLDGGPVLLLLARDAGHGRELLGCTLGLHVSYFVHQRALAHRGEADHADAAVPGLGHVEALPSGTALPLFSVIDQLRLQFCQFSF